jgi:hypothetical protein
MPSFLEKLLGVQKPEQEAKTNGLEKFAPYEDHIVHVQKSEDHPEHLIARGLILREEKTSVEIRTAIRQRGEDVEFSTNVGQLPNTSLGDAIMENLNQRFEGEFVTYDSQQETNKNDLIYATRKPYEWLDRERLNRELENHAKTKDLLIPLLSKSTEIEQIEQEVRPLDLPTIRRVAQNIVDENLEFPPKSTNKLDSRQNLPTLQTKGQKYFRK